MNDEELSTMLRDQLPRRTAPASLRARITKDIAPPRARRWRAQNIGIALACAAFVALVLFIGRRTGTDREAPQSPLVAEAVNDHLRVLYAEHPIEIESGGIHQVKPWFEGRVDFAPVVSFEGDAEFPLQGGLVAYYIDRKAAALVYKKNLHVITLLVFESRGLPWPKSERMTADARGFHTIVWRANDLGYALVSDVAMNDLETLERKLKAPK